MVTGRKVEGETYPTSIHPPLTFHIHICVVHALPTLPNIYQTHQSGKYRNPEYNLGALVCVVLKQSPLVLVLDIGATCKQQLALPMHLRC